MSRRPGRRSAHQERRRNLRRPCREHLAAGRPREAPAQEAVLLRVGTPHDHTGRGQAQGAGAGVVEVACGRQRGQRLVAEPPVQVLGPEVSSGSRTTAGVVHTASSVRAWGRALFGCSGRCRSTGRLFNRHWLAQSQLNRGVRPCRRGPQEQDQAHNLGCSVHAANFGRGWREEQAMVAKKRPSNGRTAGISVKVMVTPCG